MKGLGVGSVVFVDLDAAKGMMVFIPPCSTTGRAAAAAADRRLRRIISLRTTLLVREVNGMTGDNEY